jgi:nucleotide-binding universal stress UspA family protein
MPAGRASRKNGKRRPKPAQALTASATRSAPDDVFVCASDATPSSLPALRLALKMAAACGASVVVVHVVEAIGVGARWFAPVSPSERNVYQRLIARQLSTTRRRLEQQITQQKLSRQGVAVAAVVESRSVARGVLEAAAEFDASLIVVGKGSKAQVLAPAAEQIARLSRRPVLLAPSKTRRNGPARLIRFPVKGPRPRATMT